MNPKITISVDTKNRAIASLTGIVSVGAKVDVDVSGIPQSDVPPWGSGDDFTGPSLRFRIVDECGCDLVRYPLHKKSETVSDSWSWNAAGSKFSGTNVDFDTDLLRRRFRCVSYDDTVDLGVILDSVVDAAEYAVGKIKVRQWSTSQADDPTILPDWRETLDKLNTALDGVEASASAATSAATSAQAAKVSAESARDTAGTYANSALAYRDTSIEKANTATAKATEASASALSASGSASAAAQSVTHYPYIHQTTKHWMVWNANKSPEPGFDDTGIVAEGEKGDPGDDGVDGTSPHVDQPTGRWFVGTSDTGVYARGPKGDTGDPGEDGSVVSVSSTGTATDEVKYITIDGVEKKLAGGGDVKHSEFATLDPDNSSLYDVITLLKGQNND